MKKTLKRLTATVTALCLCAGMVFSAAAMPTTDDLKEAVAPINLTTTATELRSGSYRVQYKADLTMSRTFAEAVAFMNTGDYLQKLVFTCILEDDLVKNLAPTDADFTFSGPGSEYFISAGAPEMDNGALKIHYKLDPAATADWLYFVPEQRDELVQHLMKAMVMTSEPKLVTAAQFDQAVGSDGKLLTNARVEITYEGGNIPIYGEKMILAAEIREVKMDIDGYTAPDKDKPVYDIEVDHPQSTPEPAPTPDPDTQPVLPTPKPEAAEKGKVEVSHDHAYAGNKVTITEVVEEGYRVTNITVVDDDGNNIPVTRNGDGTYTFEMPAEHVTVTPSFDLASTRPEDSGVSEMLDTDDHIPFMVGDDKGNFRPNANITRAEVAQVFYALLRNQNVPQTVKFSDVEEGIWYEDAVNTLAALGIVEGVGNGKFAPERNITRAEFATIAANFANFARDAFGFKDVDNQHWAYQFIMSAAAYGWVAGVGNNNFEPDRGIMRAEAATIVNNMLGRIGDKEQIDDGLGRRFPDVSKSHWGWYEIVEASSTHDYDFNDTFTQEFWSDN